METESFKLGVQVDATSQAPLLGFLSTVIITVDREFEEFLIDENDDDHSIKSLGSYPDSSSTPDSLFILKLRTMEPEDVLLTLKTQLHDDLLSGHVGDEIVVKAQQIRSKSSDLRSTQQPLFMIVSVKLTQKVYDVVPRCSAPSLDTDLETCAICLEDLSGSEEYCQMPNCSHCYHEDCVTEWTKRHNDSCPLCRKQFY
ncbi:hypothetical protein CARUB_v10025620mg [Capsella rubella]|uniref:RING-type domain-containing protein n=1 Tax=Capsella rubella TaxID=81985 RepID=R0HZ35_9BRAS|nr:NEP1-interacting protein 1 [Capsella rubella]EOA29338.1 hypothetical protein CARUB_v10025620mg [Capsella rubella]